MKVSEGFIFGVGQDESRKLALAAVAVWPRHRLGTSLTLPGCQSVRALGLSHANAKRDGKSRAETSNAQMADCTRSTYNLTRTRDKISCNNKLLLRLYRVRISVSIFIAAQSILLSLKSHSPLSTFQSKSLKFSRITIHISNIKTLLPINSPQCSSSNMQNSKRSRKRYNHKDASHHIHSSPFLSG